MSDKPAAEVDVDEALVRALLTHAPEVIPDAATVAVRRVAEGWDCTIWRVGDHLAARLPRRRVAAALIDHEHLALPRLAPRLAAVGIGVPVPLFAGEPAHGYPWRWSVVPWIDGDTGIHVPREARGGWVHVLAGALVALHGPADADHPVNPMRGGALATRADGVGERVAALRASGAHAELVDAAEEAWEDGLAAHPWRGAPVWVHGDLHPGNLIARGSDLVGIIDFGDVTGGDPAYDLAVAWLAFDPVGRSAFRAAVAGAYDDATWVRARAWAAAMGLLLMAHSDDAPDFLELGISTLREVAQD
jgi:aminoglycoside phosphotransferase (APT) family kinase protein